MMTFFSKKGFSKKGRTTWCRVVVSVFLLGALSACHQEMPVTDVAPLRPVKTLKIAFDQAVPRTYYAASISAIEEITLSFKVAGTIAELPINAGDHLDSGDLLARLDAQDYTLQVQQAEANYAKARAEARNTEANYDRTRQLYEVDGASGSDLDAARAGFEASRAGVKAAAKQLDLLQRQLLYTKLNSPRSCQVANVWTEKNENVAAGQPVATLSCGNRFEARTAIPETLVSNVKVSDAVVVNLKALNYKTTGVITSVGKSEEQQAAAFSVVAELDHAPPELRSGMSAEIGFSLVREKNALIVPAIAVSEDSKGRFVYVVKPTSDQVGVIHRSAVQVGVLHNRGLEILSGLNVGEYLVIAGMRHLQEGQHVHFPSVGEAKK